MSGAAYRRGSMAITRQICAEYNCRGCVYCHEHKPTPRPADWGEKAKAKALARAQRILASAARFGLSMPSVEVLAEILRDRERVGAGTARRAAEEALGSSGEEISSPREN